MFPKRIPPGPGQESVWDYPRPPRLEPVTERLRVVFGGEVVADTVNAKRVLETSHPPSYYIPPEDVRMELLVKAPGRSFCEWKGQAHYYTIQAGERRSDGAAWAYARPTPGFADIRDHLCFYASKVDACYVGDEQVQAQEGDFYGGWITSNIVGPFKGGPGTRGW